MIDSISAPLWAWVAAAASAGTLLVALTFSLWLSWRRVVRQHLMTIVGHREAIRACMRTLESIAGLLAEGNDARIAEFATNPASEDRKALEEIASRMRVATTELDTARYPDTLVFPAGCLADAAYLIALESGRFGDTNTFACVLEILTATDLERIERVFSIADEAISKVCEAYDFDDAAVYRGGLYI